MELLMPFLEEHLKQTNPFIFVQMMVLFYMTWAKLKPHLLKIELRFEGIEKRLVEVNEGVKKGFASGDSRFTDLENRLGRLENK